MRILTIFIAELSLAVLCCASDAQELHRDYLFSDSGGSPLAADCSEDPLDLKARSEIKEMMSAIDVATVKLKFIGCKNASFATVSVSGARKSDLGFEIYYPVNESLKLSDYTAPIAHELGHVFQIRRAGEMAVLKNQLDSNRIELGADFLAGFAGKRSGGLVPLDFQTNLNLTGKYREQAETAHGMPHQRVSAFRTGYFFERNNPGIALNDAYEHFLSDAVGRILDH